MEVDPEDKNVSNVHIPVPTYPPNSNGQVSVTKKRLGFGGSWSNLLLFWHQPSRPRGHILQSDQKIIF